MAELILQAGDDHVARLAHEGDPVRAVIELIWNAIDAEATNISVEFQRDDQMGAITQVLVTDDGHGIGRDEVETTFGRIGDSWKRLATRTKNDKRGLHGKRGEGRLRAFALGNRVEWLSHSVDTAGSLQRVQVRGNTERRHAFPWDVQPAVGMPTGTVVTAWNDNQKSLAALEADSTLGVLRSHFAPVLLNDDGLAITFDGDALDPADEISSKTPITLTLGAGEKSQEAQLLIIEWKSGRHRAIYFGPDNDHFVHEESAKELEPQFTYSAYVTWRGFDSDTLAMVSLADLAGGEVAELWNVSRHAIRSHFEDRRRERRREQVATWKRNKTYPYQGDPKTEAEKAERAVFDVVAGTLSQQISTKKSDASLTLSLLRDSLRHDPQRLTAILHEVVSLSDSDRDTLIALLGETSLPAIIKAANLVASRNKFIAGLEHLLFDPSDSDKVGERDHLHRLLERELWIFGEAYHVMSSERGLTQMLRNHLKLEGLPDSGIKPVKRWDGKSGRVDLHLAVKSQEFDRTRHLVVELKAPGIKLGRKELDQVEDYANVVLSNPAFASDRAEWEFILVGTDYDAVVENRFSDDTRAVGEILAPSLKPGRPRVRAYVRRWRDVLDENKRRLAFMTTNLEHDPTLEEGLGYIRERHTDLLPEGLWLEGKTESA